MNERIIRLIAAEFNVSENWMRTGQGAMFNEDLDVNVSDAIGMFRSLGPQFQDGALKILEVLTRLNGRG